MTARERIHRIVGGQVADECGFWLGCPHPDSWPALHHHFGTETEEALRRFLGDDFRWLAPWSAYRHPQGRPIFDMHRIGPELSTGGCFAECESLREVEAYPWPDPAYLDFSEILAQLETAGDVYRASGFWSPFFHELADFFGMESYFVKMYSHPEIVHAVTEHVVDFYVEANRRLFKVAGDLIDGFFFGNDFGSQQGLLISPAAFATFVQPHFARLVDVAREGGHQVILHSCGSIHAVIPTLIDMGVDALHPLQAKAANMDAATLARDFGGRIAFIGGVDTQDLLVNGRPEDVAAEVERLKECLGPRWIISPSHEAILPDVPPANIAAMARAR